MTAAVELSVRERHTIPRPLEPRAPGAASPAGVRVVVADADAASREICADILRRDGHVVTTCSNAERALAGCAHARVDVLIVTDRDVRAEQVREVRERAAAYGEPLVIVLAEHPTVAASIVATRDGAFGYLPKPFAACQLQMLVGRAAHACGFAPEPERPTASSARNQRPLGVSPALRRAVELARKVAATTASVFITGESGSGKEMIAQLIHAESRRAARPFVPVNCAALPDDLLETEMFGHRKGAFTGAIRDKPGLLEEADGGTLFLDELLELPLPLQAKLLRVIQDGVVRRVGSETTDAVVDVRLIAATNGDPELAMRAGTLRPDLYYRLCVVPIHVPPLRERSEDIPMLATTFLAASWQRHRAQEGPAPHLSDTAMRVLLAQQWPGNVRELQNLIEHVSVMVQPGDRITAADLPLTPSIRTGTLTRPALARAGVPRAATPGRRVTSYHALRDDFLALFERRYVAALLRQAGGSMTTASRIAAVPRSTLYRIMGRNGYAPRVAGTQPSAPTAPEAAGTPVGEGQSLASIAPV
jgi:DNA-binding NtrC family response regulator